MTKDIHLVYQPTVEIIAEQQLNRDGILKMADWVKEHRPDCTPDNGYSQAIDLLPHDWSESGRFLTHNEVLVELAGRKCYDSFAEKAGQKTNKEYIANTQMGTIPHASILYHAKMSFFLAGISRRLTHELIRNYVGADRDEEGSPSQESTRFTHHYGYYVVHPKIHNSPSAVRFFAKSMQDNYDSYLQYIDDEVEQYKAFHHNDSPKGIDRKRIYEAASSFLSHSCETSLIWTTNPMALRKLFRERCDEAADREFQRFANKWKAISLNRWPNLFPGLT